MVIRRCLILLSLLLIVFSSPGQADALLRRFRTDSLNRDYIAAIRDYILYSNLQDSLSNAAKSRQFDELEDIYKTKQKEHTIIDLRNNQQIQRAELDRTNMVRRVTMSGIVVIFSIAVLLFIGLQQKRRSNIALRTHQQEIAGQNAALEEMNRQQQLLLVEKEWLTREIHHRVKNNLQTTISLLHMQSVYLSNEAALAAIRSSQRRMQAMSFIHQRLYQSEDMTSIDMSAYIIELINYLKESFRDAGNITFTQQVEAVSLDIGQAVPLGLIINEAITNAIKYAFPGNKKGTIEVGLGRDNDYCILSIADNGVSMAMRDDPAGRHSSLGLNLIRGLIEQLQGKFNIITGQGTVLHINFKPNHSI